MLESQIYLRGTIQEALFASHSTLAFSEDEAVTGKPKRITWKPLIGVDLTSARVISTSASFVVRSIVALPDQLTCEVTSKLRDDQEEAVGEICVLVTGAQPTRTLANHLSLPDPRLVTSSVSVSARRKVPLHVVPSTVCFQGSDSMGTYHARLLLRGSVLLGNGSPILKVEAPAHEVAWTISPISKSGNAVLKVNVRPLTEQRADTGVLLVQCANAPLKRVPFYLARTESVYNSQAQTEEDNHVR